MFGAESEKWDEEVFFYRTGIALDWWKKGIGRVRL
jgi:hypothetical protein